jgi:hypothetical protein
MFWNRCDNSSISLCGMRAYNVGRLELPLAGTKQEKDISDYFRLGHTATEFRRLMPRPEVRQYTQHKNGQAIKH